MDINEIKNNGIVGAGGAGFPTHIKLLSSPDTLIMNAAECEPLLHKDVQMLLHYTAEVLAGFKTALKITGAKKGIIGIKKKHAEVIAKLRQHVNGEIAIKTIGDFYPAGDEITLIFLTSGRIVQPGNLPISVGCLVQNVETLYNIGTQKPVVDKFISVAGAVEQPATIRVPIGISFADVLSQFKITTAAYFIRVGGLMMGSLSHDLNQVVDKRTAALIVLPADHFCVTMYQRFATQNSIDRIAKASCDQCTYCTEFCPRYLLGHPVRPEISMRNRMFAQEADPIFNLGSAFCCECNLCTMYACPECLDPKGATTFEKKIALQNKIKWEGLPIKPHPMMNYRRVPTEKLVQRLDVRQFKDEGPLSLLAFDPLIVRIPLSQHCGVPAKPIVKKNDVVKRNDLIAEADGDISAHVHASISGRIIEVNNNNIIIQRN